MGGRQAAGQAFGALRSPNQIASCSPPVAISDPRAYWYRLDRLQQQARSDRREMVPATLVLLCGEWSRMEFDCPLQLSDKTVDVVVAVGWPLAADKVVVVVAVKTLAVGKLASVVVDTVAVELMVRAVGLG